MIIKMNENTKNKIFTKEGEQVVVLRKLLPSDKTGDAQVNLDVYLDEELEENSINIYNDNNKLITQTTLDNLLRDCEFLK